MVLNGFGICGADDSGGEIEGFQFRLRANTFSATDQNHRVSYHSQALQSKARASIIVVKRRRKGRKHGVLGFLSLGDPVWLGGWRLVTRQRRIDILGPGVDPAREVARADKS